MVYSLWQAINVIELDADSYHKAADGKKNLLVKYDTEYWCDYWLSLAYFTASTSKYWFLDSTSLTATCARRSNLSLSTQHPNMTKGGSRNPTHIPTIQYTSDAKSHLGFWSDDILFGRLNGRTEKAIVDELGVEAYPVFKWYNKGSADPTPFYYVHYNGRHGHTLMRLVNKRLGREAHEEL